MGDAMITRKLHGRVPTIRDRQRAGMARSFNRYSPVDFDEMREIVNSREQVGPAVPLAALSILQPDKLAERERVRHWQLVAEFNRYGFCESKNYGTPFVGDAFGFGQSI
jgi:hypothetical protein